ncbi:MAG: DUF3576 domain-containing protein [Acidisphaera sp.]|nr:DUF3576 domain-containing protein [Acidisphaera sp.]MBV9812644.1 DUF3576 domain-containing protein [Acetobacteraceae bacterium]
MIVSLRRATAPGILCVGIIALGVAGCANSRPVSNDEYHDTGFDAGGAGGHAFSDNGIVLFGGNKQANPADQGTAIGVNAYLWRGALDTLSFMPLVSADPFGGVIITDWYTPPSTSGERFKATAYILGRQLRADGVRVTIFRQVQQSNQWVDAPVSADTNSEIENKVLARARELRAQSAAR